MDKLNFDIHQLFRYLLSGGWAVGCYFFIDYKQLEKISAEHAIALIVLAVIIGSVIYVIYRSLIYPVWYKIIYRILSKLEKTKMKRDPRSLRLVVFPSEIEIGDNFRRWFERKNSFCGSDIILWASQVHFLFCAAFASLISLPFSRVVGGYDPHRAFYVGLSFAILLVAAMVNSTSLMIHDFKVKEMEKHFSDVASSKKKAEG